MTHQRTLSSVVIRHRQRQNSISYQFAGDTAAVIILIKKHGEIFVLRFRRSASPGALHIPLGIIYLHAGLRISAGGDLFTAGSFRIPSFKQVFHIFRCERRRHLRCIYFFSRVSGFCRRR